MLAENAVRARDAQPAEERLNVSEDEPSPEEVLRKLSDDMHKGENAVDYWEVAACVSVLAQTMAIKLAWTKEPPTKPGWYWAHFDGDQSTAAQIVYFADILYREVCIAGSDIHEEFAAFDLWSGPIEPPPVPEDGA